MKKTTIVALCKNPPEEYNELVGTEGVVLFTIAGQTGEDLCVIQFDKICWVIKKQYLVEKTSVLKTDKHELQRLNFVTRSSSSLAVSGDEEEPQSEKCVVQVRLFKRADDWGTAIHCILRLQRMMEKYGALVEMYVEQYWKDNSLLICCVTLNIKTACIFTKILSALSDKWNVINEDSAVWDSSMGSFRFHDISFANVEKV